MPSVAKLNLSVAKPVMEPRNVTTVCHLFLGLIGSLQHACTGDVMHRECILSPAALS